MIRTTIMAEEETLYEIGRIAERDGKSKAAVIREALAEYIVEKKTEQPFENPLLGIIGIADVDEDEADDLPDRATQPDWKLEWAEHLGRNL